MLGSELREDGFRCVGRFSLGVGGGEPTVSPQPLHTCERNAINVVPTQTLVHCQGKVAVALEVLQTANVVPRSNTQHSLA